MRTVKPHCRITTATLFTVCTAVSIAVCAGSAVTQEKDPAVAIRKIRAAITATLKKDTPAVMLAVVKDGKVFFTHTEGKVGKNRKADAATLFPMGGSSRVLANLALAQLHTAK